MHIISRVKSENEKDYYIVDAINEKRLQALKKTVDIQSRMLADALDIEEKDVLRAVNEYTDALILLDQYDH